MGRIFLKTKKFYFSFFLQQDFFLVQVLVVSFGNIPTQYFGCSVLINFCLQQDFFLEQVVVVVSLGLFKDRRVSNKIVFIILIFVIYYYLDKKI